MILEHPELPKNPAAEDRLTQPQEIQATLSYNLYDAQNTQKKVADHHRCDSSTKFQVGDRVWLLQGNIKTTRPCRKLDYQRFGPCVISGKINDVTFRLDLPPHMCLHLVFYVSLLEPNTSNSILGRVSTPLPPVKVSNGSEYEVVAILDSKLIGNRLHYLVDWLGYTPNDRTWEPAENLQNASDMVAHFIETTPISQIRIQVLRLVELVVEKRG
jgi:hypothetical protein